MTDSEEFEVWWDTVKDGDLYHVHTEEARIIWQAALASEREKQNAATNVGIDWANPATLNGVLCHAEHGDPAMKQTPPDIGKVLADNIESLYDGERAKQAEPVAWLWLQDGKPVNAFLHQPDQRDTRYWEGKGYSTAPLYAATTAVQQAEPLNSAIYKIAASLAMGEPMRPLNAVLDTGKSPYQQTCNAAEKVADRLRVIAMQLRNAVDAASPAAQAKPADVTRDPRVLLAACLLHPIPLALANAIKEVLASPTALREESVAWTGQYDENGNAVEQRIAAPPADDVAWGIDWGRNGDQTAISIVKKLQDGSIEVVATEYGPPADDEAVRLLTMIRPYVYGLDNIKAIDDYLAKVGK